MKNQPVAGVDIPDSSMAKAAFELIQSTQPALLLNHSHRVFIFAVLIGEHRRVLFDAERLYIATLFHCIGLTALYYGSSNRFEVDSAHAAREFLKGYGSSGSEIAQVWDAIALHTTPGIAEHKSPLVALLAAGVEMALFGRHQSALKSAELMMILEVFPKQSGFKQDLLSILQQALSHRPPHDTGTLDDDVRAHFDRQFKRANFCHLLVEDDWRPD